MRVGLADKVPTSQAEMNAAVELFPGYGIPYGGPNTISLWAAVFVYWNFDVRKGIETGGKKLVLECDCQVATMRVSLAIIVSGLPTSMAGWMAHNK